MKTKRELARARVAREAAAAGDETVADSDCDQKLPDGDQTLPVGSNGDQVEPESEKIVSDGPTVAALSEVAI